MAKSNSGCLNNITGKLLTNWLGTPNLCPMSFFNDFRNEYRKATVCTKPYVQINYKAFHIDVGTANQYISDIDNNA